MKNSVFLQSRDAGNAQTRCGTNPPHRILVVDDELHIRKSSAEVLTRSGYQVDAVVDGEAGWEALHANNYDLLITDNNMPRMTGVELVRRLRDGSFHGKILVLSAHAEAEAMDLVRSGSHNGYLLKHRVLDVHTFLEALEQIVAGGRVIEPALARESAAGRSVRCPLDALSTRERDVLVLMAEGRSNAGIAPGIPPRTSPVRSARTASLGCEAISAGIGINGGPTLP